MTVVLCPSPATTCFERACVMLTVFHHYWYHQNHTKTLTTNLAAITLSLQSPLFDSLVPRKGALLNNEWVHCSAIYIHLTWTK